MTVSSEASASSQTSATVDATAPVDRQLRMVLIALIFGVIAPLLDTTIVTVALHTLATDLHTGLDTIAWVATAYLLALTITIPLTGWLEQALGQKRLWQGAIGIFLLGSVLCAAAWDPFSLIGFRVLQGIGAGIVMTEMQTISMRVSGGKNRARVVSTISLPVSLGPVIGPVLGGVLLHFASWRWIFLINVPVCLIALVLAQRYLPDGGRRAERARLDVVGAVTLGAGLAGVLYGLSRIERDGALGSSSVVPIVIGVVLLGLFGAWSLRRTELALVNVRLLRHRSVGSTSFMMLVLGTALYGSMFLLPLFWQNVRGADALGAALMLIPQGLGNLSAKTVIGRIVERLGSATTAVLAFTVVTLTTIPFIWADAGTNSWALGALLFVRGLGLGCVVVPILASAYVNVAAQHVPQASILTRSFQQLGGALGVALAAIMLQSGIRAAGSASGGFHWGFILIAALTALGAVASVTLRRPRPAQV